MRVVIDYGGCGDNGEKLVLVALEFNLQFRFCFSIMLLSSTNDLHDI